MREELRACLPSLVLERALAPSGQRVVYLACFDDSLIPEEVHRAETQRLQERDADEPDYQSFLLGWETWGQVVVK
ncbi:hypothetical protein [Rhizobacter sp. LjRoot28]|uniref:hypothetical protein n=1 Tax=Rhizobacter sp. LjRoot28 TaxID=3342309 RepID=UPI003ED09ECE